MATASLAAFIERLVGVTEFGRVAAGASVVYDGLGMPRSDGAAVVQLAAGGASLVTVSDSVQARARYPNARLLECGFAISPPVVNAHTHLDLSDMPFSPGDYSEFIAAVVAHQRAGGRGLAAAKRGLVELRAAGTTVIGDIVTDPEVMEYLLQQADLSGVAYWEVFSPVAANAERVFDETVAALARFRQLERPGGVRVGLSPHTPHTVSAQLLTRLTGFAAQHEFPVAIHVAESPAESELYASGRGPLAASLAGLGAEALPTGTTPVAYLAGLGALAGSPTLIHCVGVSEADVAIIARAGARVVHCPRSNEALECGRFPWELFAKHGVEVAFGTDSRGSSPNLDVTQEVEAALALHGNRMNARAAVRAAVKGGHKALAMQPPQALRGSSADGLRVWQG